MKHYIDPTVDCVFKAILGSEAHKNLLVHFLNAILEPPPGQWIESVILQNPYNPQDFIGDKLSIVDVKAIDQRGKQYQVEIQIATYIGLNHRMLYNWSQLYKEQIKAGNDYSELLPTTSIWILNDNLPELAGSDRYHHHFQVLDPQNQIYLNDHLNIHVLELKKWHDHPIEIETAKQQWLYFFREGKQIDVDSPPKPLQHSPIMEQAMTILRAFSEQEHNYHAYQKRLDFLREQLTIERHQQRLQQQIKQINQDLERMEQEKAQAEQQKAQAEQQRAQAEQEKQRYLNLLKQHGIVVEDPLE